MKREIIAILLMYLIINTSFVAAVDITDIKSTSQLDEIIKGSEQTEAEDILVNVESYNPRVVPSYAFESEQFGGYQVIASLTGLQTNPLIDIPRIRSVRLTNYKSNVSGIVLYTKAPPFGIYTLDNLGYIIIRLPRIKDERKIPEQIDIDITAKILFDVGEGFGVNEQDLTLPVLAENEFLLEKDKYSFWSGRGYVKLDEIKDGVARLTVYNGRLERAGTLTLREGRISSEMFLSYGNLFPNIGEDFIKRNLRDRFRIRLNSLDIPKDKAKLEIQFNDKFVIKELAKGDRLSEGSNWRVKDIYTKDNQDVVELFNDKENRDAKLIGSKLFSYYKCSDFDNNKLVCGSLTDCVYDTTINKCIEKVKQEAKVDSTLPRPIRNNNPLNIKQGGCTQKWINKSLATLDPDQASDGGYFLRFNDASTGFEAAKDLLLKCPVYSSLTIDEAMKKWSNNGYGAEVAPDLSSTKMVKDSTDQEINYLINQMAVREGYKPQPLTTTSSEQTQLSPEEQKASQLLIEANKKYSELEKQGKKDLSSLKPILDNYVEIMNNYKGTSVYNAAVQYYLKIYNDNLLVENKEVTEYIILNLPKLSKKNFDLIYPESAETSSISTDSKFYYEKAVEAYQKIVDNYLDIKDDKKYYAEEAQKRIAEIYDQKLFRLDKAIEAYQSLLSNFELNPVERTSIENRVNGLRLRLNYNSNPINLYEEGDSITVNLIGIEKTTSQPEIILNVNNKESTFKLGDKLPNSYWVIDSILNSQQIRLIKPTTDARISQEIKIISISDKTDIVLEPGLLVRLVKLDTKNEARITVLPGVEYLTSTSNFKLHIPVEKRLIQFSDKQIDNQIEAAKKTIEFFDKIIAKVEKVYDYFSYFCWTVFLWMTIKSLAQGGRSLARNLVMSEYRELCSNEISQKKITCDSKDKEYCITQCVFDKSKNIEKDIDNAEKIISRVKGDKYKSLVKGDECLNLSPDECRLVLRARLLNKETWNNEKLTEKFAQELYQNEYNIKSSGEVRENVDKIRKKLFDENGNLKVNKEDEQIKNLAKEVFNIDDLSKLDKDGAEEILKYVKNKEQRDNFLKYNNLEYYKSLGIPENTQSYNYIKTLIQKETAQISQISSIERSSILKDERGYYYSVNGRNFGYIYTDKKGTKFNENLKDIIDKELYVSSDEKEYRSVNIVSKITTGVDTKYISKINLENFGKCDEWVKRITVNNFDYVEVTKRSDSGDCTPREFAVRRRDKANDPLGNNKDKYVRTQINVEHCEEGKYKAEIKEYCDVINKIQSLDRNLIKGKKTGESVESIGIKYLIEDAVVSGVNQQCYDVMDPSDCKILFAACDPVMCPPSRFNAGGKWYVNNVVASGIFGSVFLGLHLWDINQLPPEVGICIPGVLAGLKNYRSIFQGYQQCMETKKQKGENIGICDTIRSIGICRIAWREGLALLRVDGGLLGVLSRNVIDSGSGGGEYAFFTQNLKKTGEFLDFFTSQYATTYFNAFRGGSTDEIGDQLCEAAIYGKLPGPGSFLDQLTRPEGPPQFIAVLDEFPHSEILGESLSDYSVYYHIYAGESYERISYTVWLESSTLNLPRLYVTQEGSLQQTAYLNRGDFADLTVRKTSQTGYDQICVEINKVKKCGFGKVSTEFLVDFAQEQLAKSELEKTNITSESECKPDKTIISQATSFGALGAAAGSILSSGTTYTGVRRECGIENPGKSTKEELYWKEVGTCGKDSNGGDKGKCWLDIRSATVALKNKESFDEINKIFEEDNKIKEQLDELDKQKLGLMKNLEQYRNDLKINKTGIKKTDLIKEVQDLIDKYKLVERQTLNPIYSARVLFSTGELYENLANTLRTIEIKEQTDKSNNGKNGDKPTKEFSCIIEYEENSLFSSETAKSNFYYRFNKDKWEIKEPTHAPFIGWTEISEQTCNNRIFESYDPIYNEMCDNILKNINLNEKLSNEQKLANGIGYLAYIANRDYTPANPRAPISMYLKNNDFLIIHTQIKGKDRIEINPSDLHKLKTNNERYNLVVNACNGEYTGKPEIKKEEAKDNFLIRITLKLTSFGTFIGDWLNEDEEYIFDGVGWKLPAGSISEFGADYELGIKIIEQQILKYKDKELEKIFLECGDKSYSFEYSKDVIKTINKRIENNCGYKDAGKISLGEANEEIDEKKVECEFKYDENDFVYFSDVKFKYLNGKWNWNLWARSFSNEYSVIDQDAVKNIKDVYKKIFNSLISADYEQGISSLVNFINDPNEDDELLVLIDGKEAYHAENGKADLNKIKSLCTSNTVKLLFIPVFNSENNPTYQEYSNAINTQYQFFVDTMPSNCNAKNKFEITKLNLNEFNNIKKTPSCLLNPIGVYDLAVDYGIKNLDDFDILVGVGSETEPGVVGMCLPSETRIIRGLNKGIIWFKINLDIATFAHEMGHLFGFSEQYCSKKLGGAQSSCNDDSSINPLSKGLGCDIYASSGEKSCCGKAAGFDDPSSCLGNKNQFGGRSIMSNVFESGKTFWDQNELEHINKILQC